MDRARYIFGNEIDGRTYKKVLRKKEKFRKKFGDDSKRKIPLWIQENPIIKPFIGVENIVTHDTGEELQKENGIIIGNIRMGYGHYRISMAIASAANHLGYTPYWFDLNSFKDTTGGKIIAHLNDLYSMGSRLSQKYGLFNRLYWEPLNSEGFKKLTYNASDQKVAELMTTVYGEIPKDMPFVATHVWPAQAAVHAGIQRVINVIPDNWPMALHLAEGSIHTVQTPSSYFGYKTLKGMDGDKVLNPIPSGEIEEVGHYVDHELVANIEVDCTKRIERIENGDKRRILLTIGGAGAQKDFFVEIIKDVIKMIEEEKACLFINIGDHKTVWEDIKKEVPQISRYLVEHMDNWDETKRFAEDALGGKVEGIHLFYNEDIFAAVYGTNLLMRASDVLITKPSELSFYPVPKLLIKRVGGHEAWGAVRSAEIGDGTIECETIDSTKGMLREMIYEDKMLRYMCDNIIKGKKAHVYDGAYNVIKLAVKDK